MLVLLHLLDTTSKLLGEMCRGRVGSIRIAEGQPLKIVEGVDDVMQLVVMGRDPLDCCCVLVK